MIEAWRRYWFGPYDAHAVAAFRILMGISCLLYYLSLAPHVTTLFSSHGVYVPFLIPDLAPPPAGAWAIYLASVASFALLTIGWRPRLMAFTSLLGVTWHYFLYFATQNSSYDRLFAFFLLVLCLSESGRVWAIGARPDPEAKVPTWPARVIRFQVIILYLGAGLWKAFNKRWATGTLLKHTFMGMWASDLARAVVQLDLSDRAWDLMSWSVIAFEFALPAALFFRRTRWLGVIAGAAFHLFNTTFLLVPWFMVCVNTYVFFIEPETLKRWVARARQVLRRDRSS